MTTWARTSRRRRAGCLLAAVGLLAASPLVAQPALSVRAGLDGRARAGRWMPVAVILSSDTARDGRLSVSWGDARVTRPVHLIPGAPLVTTTALRTGDPRARVTATFEDGTASAEASAGVTIVPDDETLTACLGEQTGCDAVVAPQDAPLDWRAWDAADVVRPAPGSAVDAAAADALARASGERRAEAAFEAPLPAMLREAPLPAARLRSWLLLMLLPLLAAGLPWSRRAGLRLAGTGLAVVAMSAAAAGVGHTGPPAVLRHVTTVHAFAGAGVTLVETRAAITSRAGGPLRLSLPGRDGWIEPSGPGLRPVTLDESGVPVLDLTPRLGETLRVDARASGPPSPLQARIVTGGVTVTHTGLTALSGCHAPGHLTPTLPGTLTPGMSMTLAGVIEADDAITCEWDGAPALVATGVEIRTVGSTMQLHLDPVTP